MTAIQATARRAGLIYFVFMIAGIVELVLPSFVVTGDAAATARRILADPMGYRLDLLLRVATLVLFVVLTAELYALLRDVDRGQALLMVLLVSVGIAVAFTNLLVRFVPIVLLSGAEYLSAFTKPQLDALVLSALRFHGNGSSVAMAFWGLWLFPFGWLVMRSGFLPRVLGLLLLVAGVGYVVASTTSILFPDLRRTIFRVMMPLYFGEVPIIFWLLLKGARAPAHAAATTSAG